MTDQARITDHLLFTHKAFPVVADARPGFTPGTRIATPDGLRPVEGLAVGDTVLTRAGPIRIARLLLSKQGRADWAYTRAIWPVRVPVGSLGNPRPMQLAAEQTVLLRGKTAERMSGQEEVAVALRDLVGLRGVIVTRPLAELRYHGFSFGVPAVVEAEGVPCEIEPAAKAKCPSDEARAIFTAMHGAGEPTLRADLG